MPSCDDDTRGRYADDIYVSNSIEHSAAFRSEKRRATVALDILHRRPVPPAVFVKHQLVTPENVNHIYPNDGLMLSPMLPS